MSSVLPSKDELAPIIAVLFALIFAGIIIYIFVSADLDIKMTGTIDPNTLLVVFVAIVNATILFFGIRRAKGA